ncbi:short-chain dehydrogenase reductase sdr [Pochonia chlamydosporia 170]|uniref:Short-chain dehydrogenase reductase sdr n=1 Tax=Pochonia chlamydosporia 170 TaxID=1380566 RepID=A0A179FKB3_METCM|nr:short-chain dehydrogenase reductase sdr [Pochonia chlamydosporia 170]OAQ65984.1 short-chain dehydrogenase reductase sdr [Pochonia chlamydosporia 170]
MSNPSEPQYLAQRPGQCCTKGFPHRGESRGTYQTIAAVETYTVHPHEAQHNGHMLLFFADVTGMSINNRLLMDGFSNAGYLVLGLNYFQDDPLDKHKLPNGQTEPGFDFDAWVDKHVKSAAVLVPKWLAQVQSLYGAHKKYCSVGYCFGAQYALNALGDGTASVGAFAHPAFLTDEHFANIKGPLFMACCQDDDTFSSESRNKAVEVLAREKKDWQMQLFPKVGHGFACRGNMDVPYERYVKETSFAAMVNWFDFWLSQ